MSCLAASLVFVRVCERLTVGRLCRQAAGAAVRSLRLGALFVCVGSSALSAPLEARLNEQVIMIPVAANDASYALETTLFKPPGAGPFPLLLLNHGKAVGDPRSQARDRFLAVSQLFVSRGYAVAIPMRRGFARSGGTYREFDCDMAANGQLQADDIQAALHYLQAQPWVDRDRVVVAGQSYGGLATLALGTRHLAGVRGLINFAGGLRLYGSDCAWQSSLVAAFHDYGKHTTIPSIWFYGRNDHHFSPALARQLYRAYAGSGVQAKLVAFGSYRNDAHGMGASWGGVKIWWPDTEKFLRAIGMPTRRTVMLAAPSKMPDTHFAPLEDVAALPYLDDCGTSEITEPL